MKLNGFQLISFSWYVHFTLVKHILILGLLRAEKLIGQQKKIVPEDINTLVALATVTEQ